MTVVYIIEKSILTAVYAERLRGTDALEMARRWSFEHIDPERVKCQASGEVGKRPLCLQLPKFVLRTYHTQHSHRSTSGNTSVIGTFEMAEPLTPLSPAHTNRGPATSSEKHNVYSSPAKRANRSQDNENIPFDPQLPSSPFVEDLSPVKSQSDPISQPRSPKKGMRGVGASPQRLTEDALRQNEGLTRVMNSAIDPDLGRRSPQKVLVRDDDNMSAAAGGAQGFAGMDDTCFSAFSAVPNVDMTRFANMDRSPEISSSRHPPIKIHGEEGPTPRTTGRNTPSRNRHPYEEEDYASPTPRHHKIKHDNNGDTTNLLMDFTNEHITTNTSNRSPTRHGHPSPRKFPTQPDLSTYSSSRRTPSPTKYPLPPGTPNEARNLANLLDFDLPPAPTPRSIPSISARELESMKSRFLSQVSSLTATLSGKEAEVRALKDAVTDAERRAGEAQEQIRDERSAKEELAVEKAEWEKRQGEMQTVLKDVKEEIIRGDREKDTLLQRVHEAEHKREEAESRITETESQIEGLRAAASIQAANKANDNATSTGTNSEVEAAVTKVAKELHGLYKSKHEAKVTALKKSYSDRWEKKVRDLSNRIDELTKENEDLRIGRDATISAVLPGQQLATAAAASRITNDSEGDASKKREEEAHTAALQQQQRTFDAKLSTLQSELSDLQTALDTNATEKHDLKTELAACRAEIASLIDASEELMLLSSSAMSSSSRPASTEPPPMLQQHSQSGDAGQKSFSRSISGSSGLQRPGFSHGNGGESRIGRVGGHGSYPTSSGTGRDRSGSGLGRSGGILSNIEKMGRGREG